MILMIDNYDSFTYNIVQYFGELQQDITVWRNDEISIEQIKALAPDVIVIGPGPCTPDSAGISLELIDTFKGMIPILGICLGHQAIGQAFGQRLQLRQRVARNHLLRHRAYLIQPAQDVLFRNGLILPADAVAVKRLIQIEDALRIGQGLIDINIILVKRMLRQLQRHIP